MIVKNEIGVLAENGHSLYSIVMPLHAPTIEYAARELQLFLSKITGVEVSITSDQNLNWDESQTYISLGNTELFKQSSIVIEHETLNGDGFIIKTKGKSVFINAYKDRGIIYGVYDFLETQTGLRFVAYDCTYIPKMIRLPLFEIDRTEVPGFEYRGYISNMTYEHVTEEDFTVRMRFNYQYAYISDYKGGKIGIHSPRGMNGVHNSLWWVEPGNPKDPQSLCRQHPEVFVWHPDGTHPIDMCWGLGIKKDGKIDENVKVSAIKILIEKAKKELCSASKSTDIILVGLMDSPLDGSDIRCKCEKCSKEIELYTYTGIVLRFMNIVADELAEFGNKVLGRKINTATLCYGYTVKAPLINNKLADPTVKPRSNLYLQIAPYFGDFYLPYNHKDQDTELKKLFDDWQMVHDKFYLWAYSLANNSTINNWLYYFDATWMWKEFFSYLQKIGVENFFFQGPIGDRHIFQPTYETYLLSKMLWNSKADIEAVKEEFFLLYYGPASKYISKAVRNFNEHYAYEIKINGLNFRQNEQHIRLQTKYHPLPFLQKQIELCNTGIKAIENAFELSNAEKQEITKRIKAFCLTPKYLVLCNFNEYFPESKAELKEYIKEFFNECREIGVKEVAEYWSTDALEVYYKSNRVYGDAYRYF